MGEGLTGTEPRLCDGCLARYLCRLCSPCYNLIRCLSFLFSFLRKRNRFELVSSFAYVHTLVNHRGRLD